MTKLIQGPGAPPAPPEGELLYGWRELRRELPGGIVEFVRVPLTAEDVLHPREGDVIPERTVQEQERGYLARVFRFKLTGREDTLVTADCLIDWGVAGIRSHSPDVAVFDGVREPNADYRIFPAAEQGARPLLVVEIVSPRDRDPEARNNDVVHKYEEYYRVGIPLYLIIDQEREGGPRRLVLYRHTPQGYTEVPADDRGRVLLEPVQVLVGLRDNRATCYDAQTGKELGEYAAVATALLAAEDKVRALEEELQRLRNQASAPRPSNGPAPE